jgi:RecQ-mediated genome instability protein 1
MSGKGKEREVQLAQELRLSPHRHGPVVVPDSDSEASPPRKAPAFRGKNTPSLATHPEKANDATGSGHPARGHSPNSSEFGFEFDENEEFLSQLDKAEKEAYAATSTTLVGAPQVLTREHSSSSHLSGPTPATLPTATSSQSRASRPPEQRRRTPRSGPAINLGTIVIDDDGDSDEKENLPVLTRRVRQRTISRQVTVDPEDVIEISD